MFFRRAVLVMHGFAGGVYDLEPLLYTLTPIWNLDVYTFTLPGHDRNLSSDVKFEDWIKSAEEHIERLIDIGYGEIYLVGHSMGGVLATYLAGKYYQVKKLVLAAPAFQYLAPPDENKVVKVVKKAPSIVKTYHAKEIISRFLKSSPSMFAEFNKLVEMSQDYPKNVTVPILIIQGDNDDIVPKESSEYVFQNVKSKFKRVVIIEGMDHDVFRTKKSDIVIHEIYRFICSHVKKKQNGLVIIKDEEKKENQ